MYLLKAKVKDRPKQAPPKAEYVAMPELIANTLLALYNVVIFLVQWLKCFSEEAKFFKSDLRSFTTECIIDALPDGVHYY